MSELYIETKRSKWKCRMNGECMLRRKERKRRDG